MELADLANNLMLAQIGGGALAGIAVGYATKKVTKIILFFSGLCLLGLYGLMKMGVITVHWDAVSHGIESGTRSMASVMVGVVKELSATFVGFTGGFWIGLKLR